MSGIHSSSAAPGPLPQVGVGRPRRLGLAAPFRWLRLGWNDLWRAPCPSLAAGGLFVAVGWVLAYLSLNDGNYLLLFSLVTGFVLIAPVLAFVFYAGSRALQRGERPTIRGAWRSAADNLGSELVFAVILGVVLLVWMRAAAMIHVFYPSVGNPDLADLLGFAAVMTTVGALFAILVFGISAFSLPMMLDTGADVVTSVITSLRAVAANKATMAVWAALVVTAVGIGFVTAMIGLAVTLPLIGHATWHAYRETIEHVPVATD